MSREKIEVFKDETTGEWAKKDESTGEMLELTEKDKAITGMIDVLESANLPRMITNVDIAITFYEADYRKQDEDTVEVVRCKDCKFNVANMEKDPLDITDYSGDDIVCSYFMTDGLEPTDFCSYGAKMKGE